MAPKQPDHFTTRVHNHPYIASTDDLHAKPVGNKQHVAVKDIWLVEPPPGHPGSPSYWLKQWSGALHAFGVKLGEKPSFISTVFHKGPNTPSVPHKDVEIWHVPLSSKTVFDAVRALRLGPFKQNPRGISPNHVLDPCPNGGFCPWGPPAMPAPDTPIVPLAGSGLVTVIDSGYLWGTGQMWGQTWMSNPLLSLSSTNPDYSPNDVQYAQYIDYTTNPPTWQPPTVSTAPLDNATAEAPDEGMAASGKPGTLDRIAGHANFVTGVVARRCPTPTISVWSHDGAFASTNTRFPTEASVARSLWMAAGSGTAGVINLGFAYDPLQGLPSTAWDYAFATIDPDDAVICPAGNENDTAPRYPAAFYKPPATTAPYVKKVQQVAGVASLAPSGTGSVFTNYGPWVACSTKGENIYSTFLDWNGPVEDGGTINVAGWANWSGTSFAAPRLAAAVVNHQMATGLTPLHALNDLLMHHSTERSSYYGWMLPDLP